MKTIAIAGVLLAALRLSAASVDITTMGAKGDGKTENREKKKKEAARIHEWRRLGCRC